MKKEDLTEWEKLWLTWCHMNPGHKYDGLGRLRMNILSSYGLAKFIGNMQYELTKQGEEILQNIC